MRYTLYVQPKACCKLRISRIPVPVVGVAGVVDEREGGVGGAPDPPHFDFVAAIIIVLLGDDGLVRVETKGREV